MEIVIVICLLIVIGLLLQDKINIYAKPKKVEKEDMPDRRQPDIIGHSKTQKRQIQPNNTSERQLPEPAAEVNKFDQEIKKKDLKRQIPQEELDDIFSPAPVDLEEEEEEWKRYQLDDDDGFAQGVTFEELAAVGMILRQEIEEPSVQIKAAEIVHKIQGTELFTLLENSTQDASQRIAKLLDSRFSLGVNSASSTLRNDLDLDGFDIGEFV